MKIQGWDACLPGQFGSPRAHFLRVYPLSLASRSISTPLFMNHHARKNHKNISARMSECVCVLQLQNNFLCGPTRVLSEYKFGVGWVL
jgi:hypothetical protein